MALRSVSRLRTGLGPRALLVAALLAAVPLAPASALVVDSFATNQPTLSDPPGGANLATTAGADIVGLRRGQVVGLLSSAVSGSGPVTAGVSGGAFNFSVADTTPNSRGEATLTWDGDIDPLTLSPTGLGGQNLTASNHTSFRLQVVSATAGCELTLRVHSDATRWSRASLVLPQVVAPTAFFMAYGFDFYHGPGGAADFADVGALILTARCAEGSLVLDQIDTVGPSATFTKQDLTTGDVPLSGPVLPGTTYKYRLVLSNTGGAALNVDLTDTVDVDTNLDPATLRATPIAGPDAYETFGNVRVTVPAPGVLGNDLDPDTAGAAPELVVGAGTFATVLGGSITLAADGSFVYDPPVGVGNSVDTVTYQLTDNDGQVAIGGIKIHLGQRVWFVDDAHPGANLGTRDNPFVGFTAGNVGGVGGAGDQDAPGDVIFLFAGTHTSGLQLEAGQLLIGEGSGLVLDGQTVVPAGAAPVLTSAGNGIVVASNNTLRGFTIGNTGATSVDLSGSNFGTLTVSNVTLSGAGGALDLDNGTLAASFTSVASTSGINGIDLDTVTGSLSIPGGTSISGVSGTGIRITNGGSSYDFGATTISAPSGVSLTSSATSTFTFSSLAITASGGAGLLANNGGTLAIAGSGNSVVATGGPAVDVTSTSFGAGATFATVSSTSSSGKGLNLDTVSGSFVATGGAISGSANVAFDVNAGSSTISYGGTIANASNRAIEVTGRTGGTLTVSGAVTDSGSGVNVASNSAGTINLSGSYSGTAATSQIDVANNSGTAIVNFSGSSKSLTTGASNAIDVTSNGTAQVNFTGGGLAVTTTSGFGFNATGGGNVTVQGAGNTLSATTGTALNVASTAIGTGNLNFTSISASGGANGIVLTNTCGGVISCASASGVGSLIVNGDGVNTSLGGNGSGGTLANMVGADGATSGIAIYLDNTKNVTLRRMTINGTNQNFGIRGFSVAGLTLEYSTVAGTAGTNATIGSYGEGGIYFGGASGATGLTGSATVTSCAFSGARARNFSLVNTSGTLDRLTVTGTTFGLTNSASDNDSLAVEARNSGTVVNATVTGSTFTGAAGDIGDFTGQTGTTMDVVFTGNTVTNTHPNNIIGGGGMTFATQGIYTLNASNNSFRGANGSAITLQKASAGTSLTGTLGGNTIGVTGVANSGSATGNGIFFSFAGGGTITLALTNNQIRRYTGNAAIFADNTGGTYDLNLTVTGNLAAEPGGGAFAGFAMAAGAPSSSDDIDICAQIGGAGALQNDFSAGDPANSNDVILGVSTGASSIRLPGYSGTTLSNVQSFVLSNNNFAGTVVTAYVDAPATAANFTGGAACPQP